MSVIECLIVEDEPIARDILVNYCGQIPNLQVKGIMENAIDAWTFLQNNSVDLIFLDIEMPQLDGLRFLETLKNPPFIVFTTAYTEYAVKAFELAVSDYLLKPFSFERFLIAVDRVLSQMNARNGMNLSSTATDTDYIFIKAEGKIFRIRYEEILYAEASGNYSTLVTRSGRFLPNMPFSNLEELLPAASFIRVHRSFIINKSQISYIEGNRVFIEKNEIPIGNNYRETMLKKLGL
ncbi:MAG: response regulator transcription factor [Chitinophaga sp.]|uniref:LytR/AlgR family response regulator transcription factor n=1 Tax=Chitinophaga sp. TaxID=1869181 RepID=UPI001B284059|nr:LytTR family DNA-binding domain-containing protein [Chitinophaga sp.]MBO9731490.1 response regulator transcription factor [Chitinophaga sp.]